VASKVTIKYRPAAAAYPGLRQRLLHIVDHRAAAPGVSPAQ
jgi:hypothetical protein